MPFFEPLPPEPDELAEQPTGWRPPAWDRPSEALLGAPVGLTVLLAKTDRVAVAIMDVEAFPNGFSFDVVILGNPMTPRPPGSPPFGIGHGAGRLRGPRVGLEFSDGSRAAADGPPPIAGNTFRIAVAKNDSGVPTTPVLFGRGGGGGGGRFRMGFWCFPLPPSGPLRLYIDWEDQSIPETMTELDANAILDAVPRVVTLWEAGS